MRNSSSASFFGESSDIVGARYLLAHLDDFRFDRIPSVRVQDHINRLRIQAGPMFTKNFIFRTEEEVIDEAVSSWHLNEDSLDSPIFSKLDEPAIVINHALSLMGVQSIGQEGFLAVNGFSNVSYAYYDDILWTFKYRWLAFGHNYWTIEAHRFNHRHGWRAGCRIISRNRNL